MNPKESTMTDATQFSEAPEKQYRQDQLPPAALDYIRRQANGDSMNRLTVKRETAQEMADMSNYPAFSIINFNPIRLGVEWATNDLSPLQYNHPLANKVAVKYGSGERVGSLLVVRNYKGYHAPISARDIGDPSVPDCDYDWHIVYPIELARPFEHNYNNGQDGTGAIGGVLVFQGHAKQVLESKRNDIVIHVPATRRAKNKTLIYYAEPISLAEKLDDIFTKQKAYCFEKLRVARSLADHADPQLQASVHDGVFSAWAQFAIDMGWTDVGQVDWLMRKESGETCKKCGTIRKSASAMFCSNPACLQPFDPFAAYMAGMKVDLDTLAMLPDDQRKIVAKEMKRRANLFKDFEPEK